MAKQRAVFLDRDGVLNQVVYNPDFGTLDSPSNVNDFHLLPGVTAALRDMSALGLLLVVASNQPGIAKGKMSRAILESVTEKMRRDLAQAGVGLAGVYYCLHHPEASVAEHRTVCGCRKPRPGLLLQAAQELDIDLGESFMIGDGLTDVQAGQAAGCRTVLIGNHKCDLCTKMEQMGLRPDYIAADLAHAKRFVEESSRK